MFEYFSGLESQHSSHSRNTSRRMKMNDSSSSLSSTASTSSNKPKHFYHMSSTNDISTSKRHSISRLRVPDCQFGLSHFCSSLSRQRSTNTLSTSSSSFHLFLCIILVLLSVFCSECTATPTSISSSSTFDKAFFNITSLITIPNSVWDLQETKQFSFKTCSDSGSLLSMRGSLHNSDSSTSSSSSSSSSSSGTEELTLSLYEKAVMFVWSISGQSGSVSVGEHVNNNKWYTLILRQTLGSLKLSVQAGQNSPLYEVEVANSTTNSLLRNIRLVGSMEIGKGFQGCIYKGPGVDLSAPQVTATNINWDTCPLDTQEVGCGERDDCWNAPCERGQCEDIGNDFKCNCPRNYGGKRCEIDLARLYGCGADPCMNGGVCQNLTETNADGRNYRCVCADGYTGVDCETKLDYCRAQPCPNGRCVSGVSGYTCNCTGSGYEGDLCTDDINECQTDICGSNRCSNHPGGFSCNCPAGYEGAPCQEINECKSSPCKNGAACSDGVNSYTCTCLPGYTGLMCEVDINECTDTSCTNPNTRCVDEVNSFRCECLDGFSGDASNCVNINECIQGVCMNNATCHDTPGSYTCDCVVGFTGQTCEFNINDCDPDPCENNASCTDLVNDYNCSCLPGFRGKNCEENINDCEGVTCLNGARCVDKINDFECECQDGWEGRYCNTNINDCDPNPCKNGARCLDELGGYLCQCRTGYNGTTCSNNINDCLPNPCQNGGECYDGVNDFNCICDSIWMGKTCSEQYDACSFNPCRNQANCTTLPPLREYSCSCLVGFSGKNCEENIDDCSNHDCESYEKCYDGINTYTCGCPVGYSGDRCETEIDECLANPCQNNGTCNDMKGAYNCTCQQEIIDITKEIGPKGVFLTGYNGSNCEIDIDECAYTDPPICQNGAICKNSPLGSFTCYCKSVSEDGSLNVGKLCESQKTYCDLAKEECANGGTCVEMAQSSSCQCAPGFTGEFCKTDIDECESNPCQNGGTCSDRVNGYECTCIEGITGHNCDIDIDDCLPDPCQHGGVCQDLINNFSCNCSNTGYNGDQCENNIDDCVGNPCQHGGTCRDGIMEYSCDCLAGYTGPNCEVDVAECASVPCYNGSLCLEYSNESLYDKGDDRFVNFSYQNATGYVCDCVPGLTGENCTEDVNECEPDPCINGASCVNLFNAFFCKCAKGYYGKTCQYEVDECQVLNPCKNGGQCTDLVADYSCACQEPVVSGRRNYGGKNCTTYLKGCDEGNECGNNGDCLPRLDDEERDLHAHTCLCRTGYTGDRCDRSTVCSFSNGSYIRKGVNGKNFDLSLRFKTTLPNALLAVFQLSSAHWIAVRLHQGMIQYKNGGDERPLASWTSITTSAPLNDANFHSLQIVLINNITVVLPGETCISNTNTGEQQRCRVEVAYDSVQTPVSPYLYIGSAKDSALSDKELEQNFVGCMEDVIFNTNLFYPGLNTAHTINLFVGCPRQIQCNEDTCSRQGVCHDLWDTFQCDCHRPYFGLVCDKDYTPATFEGKPDSHAEFTFRPGEQFQLSFLITTRQTEGFIIYAGNLLTQQSSKRHTFISLYIQNGFLMGDLVICNYVNRFSTSFQVNDGEAHLIAATVKTKLTLHIDETVAYESENFPVLADRICRQDGFYASSVFIGKLDKLLSRRKRSILNELEEGLELFIGKKRTKRQATTGDDVINANKQLDAFDGVIQDARVYALKLRFSENSSGDGLTAYRFDGTIGAHNTRDSCTEDMPCQNGGNCSNVYFNDFSCDCKFGYRGKNCSELDFCSYGTCPDQSTCVNIQEGYECVSTAQYNGLSMTTFSLGGNASPIPKVTIKFRTRAHFGALFFAGRDDYFIKLRIAKGHLELNYKLTVTEFSKSATTLTPKIVNDGEWYTAMLEVNSNGTLLELSVLHNGVSVAGLKRISIDSGVDGGLDVSSMLVTGPHLALGATTNNFNSPVNQESFFVGCIEQARIGGVLLPFFTDNQFQNNTVPVKYLLQYKVLVTSGCTSPDVCQTSKCANGGKCVDEWYASSCQCVAGYEGMYCEENPNNCLGTPCSNQGRCVDGLNSYSCDCPTGFTGDRCETDVNFCSSSSSNSGANDTCMNSGVCVEESSGYSCNCTEEYTGRNCGALRNQSCSPGLCQNSGTCRDVGIVLGGKQVLSFKCECTGGFNGPLCEVPVNGCDMQPLPCANGGSCTISSQAPYYTCDCKSIDYEGQNCTDIIDNCKGVTCGDHGKCIDGNRTYTCQCDQGYTGQNCEASVNSCSLNPCQRGKCLNNTCNCTGTGYEGEFCQQETNECNKSVCVHANSCFNLEGDYNCTCSLGYTGKDCHIPNCTGVCQNGATCRTNATSWWCDCPEFYDGIQCEIKGPCADNPCNVDNTNTCSQNVTANTYTCDCKTGWEGKNCSQNIDECQRGTDNCIKGQSQCKDNEGSFTCVCDPGYVGSRCETDFNECATQPCKNGGKCTDRINSFDCNCTDTGFTGLTCNVDINECTSIPGICNKGNCSNNDGGFNCDCGLKYLGNRCEHDDPCYNSTCSNQGVCVKNKTQNGSYQGYCECSDGYDGFNCEKSPSKSKDDDDTDMALILGPIIGSVLFIIIIIILIAFIMTARSKRATRGAYSPSQQETSGSRVELGNVLKKPPEERLI